MSFLQNLKNGKHEKINEAVTTAPPVTAKKSHVPDGHEKKEKSARTTVRRSRTKPKEVLYVPEFPDILKWCRDNRDNDDVKVFLRHAEPRANKRRRGGGWSGAIRLTLSILRQMRREMEK